MSEPKDWEMRQVERLPKQLRSPLRYAAWSIVATPLSVTALVIAAVVMLVAWPIVPVCCYFQRRRLLRDVAAGRVLTPFDEPWP